MHASLLLLCCLVGQPDPDEPAHGHDAAMEMPAEHAHDFPPPRREQSALMFLFQALGFFYTVGLFGSGMLLFVGAVLVVLLGRPPVIAAYLVFVPIPLLIGLYGIFDGMIAAFRIIATSTMAPKPSEVAEGISTALVSGLVGTGVVIPSLLILAFGLLVKSALASTVPAPSEMYGVPPVRT